MVKEKVRPVLARQIKRGLGGGRKEREAEGEGGKKKRRTGIRRRGQREEFQKQQLRLPFTENL